MTSEKIRDAKFKFEIDLNNLGVYISDLTDKELKNFDKVKAVNTIANSIRKRLISNYESIITSYQAMELENEYLKKKNNVLSKIVEYRDKIEELRKEL